MLKANYRLDFHGVEVLVPVDIWVQRGDFKKVTEETRSPILDPKTREPVKVRLGEDGKPERDPKTKQFVPDPEGDFVRDREGNILREEVRYKATRVTYHWEARKRDEPVVVDHNSRACFVPLDQPANMLAVAYEDLKNHPDFTDLEDA